MAYAVQFHVEVTEAMGEEWAEVPDTPSTRTACSGPGGSDQLLVEFHAGTSRMQAHARAMFERWCDLAEAVEPLVRVQRGVEAVPARARARQRLDGAALRVAPEEHPADARQLARARQLLSSGRRTLVPAVR